MSFLYNLTHNMNPHKQIGHIDRKEKQDSLVAMNKNPLIIYKRERASAFTSKGSLTLEAAIVVPIFFFAMLCLAYLLEMMAIQTTVRNALYSVGKEVAQQAYVGLYPSHEELEQRIIDHVGRDRLERSVVFGGVNGIDSSATMCDWSTGIVELNVQYKVEIPVLMFRIAPVTCEETLRVKGWNGYVLAAEDVTGEKTVYVTETGIVYHRDADCTYLDMSIQSVHVEKLEELRNQSGGKYYACESCGKDIRDVCYITDYGTRYHTSLECKKIQRKVYAIPIEEAYGLGGCSKCVK